MSGHLPLIPQNLASRIKLVIFDVDGVLTDAGIYVGTTQEGQTIELKRFNLQDNVGMIMLGWETLDVAIVSGRVSAATAIRAEELGIECYQEPDAYKLPAVEGILSRKGIAWDEVAMLADDIPDLAVLRKVGLPAAVANATKPVRDIAVWKSEKTGGNGAVREFTDALLHARGTLGKVIEQYVADRSRS